MKTKKKKKSRDNNTRKKGQSAFELNNLWGGDYHFVIIVENREGETWLLLPISIKHIVKVDGGAFKLTYTRRHIIRPTRKKNSTISIARMCVTFRFCRNVDEMEFVLFRSVLKSQLFAATWRKPWKVIMCCTISRSFSLSLFFCSRIKFRLLPLSRWAHLSQLYKTCHFASLSSLFDLMKYDVDEWVSVKVFVFFLWTCCCYWDW